MMLIIIIAFSSFIAGFILCGVLAARQDNHVDCESCEALKQTCDALKSCQADCSALEELVASLKRSCSQLRADNNRLYGKMWYQNRVGIAR